MSKRESLKIDGLVPIQPPQNVQNRRPNLLTEDELINNPIDEEWRHIKCVLDPQKYAHILLGIQTELQWLTNTGQNDELTGLEDFDIAVVTGRNDGQGVGWVDSGAGLAVRSHRTGRTGGIYDLIPPNGWRQQANDLGIAFALRDLARPLPPPPAEE
jgi:hypothetical protein